MAVVVDASALVPLVLSDPRLGELRRAKAIAPELLWHEAIAALHSLVWRREITADQGNTSFTAVFGGAVSPLQPAELLLDAWRLADEFGWAKTYDAEYVALARRVGCPLLTFDVRLARTVSRVVDVIGPADL